SHDLATTDISPLSLHDALPIFLVDRLQRDEPAAELSPNAREALDFGRGYGKDVRRLREDSSWARHLTARGRGRDVAACLMLDTRSEEHTSELQSLTNLVCRLLL